ncbi:secreted protein [Candidatus Magnetomorum sp. HK-1]|nr:secreted protein [Candidatus Magnetomorum sp. HK-1]
MVKTRGNQLFFSLFCAIAALAFIPAMACAFPMEIDYQFSITDANDAPINGPVSIGFIIWDSAEGGSDLWSDSYTNVTAINGNVKFLLGEKEDNPLDTSVFDGEPYISIRVGNDDFMEPRRKFTSVPFAIQAKSIVNGGVTTESIADNAVTQSKIADNSISAEKFQEGAVLEAISNENGQLDAALLDGKLASDYALKTDMPSLDDGGNMTISGGIINLRELEPDAQISPTVDYGKIYVKTGGPDYDAADTLTNGLVLYYKMDQEGEKVYDQVNSANDAIAYSGVSNDTGVLGKAKKIVANQEQYIEKAHSENIDFDRRSFTISFWMKAPSPDYWSIILSKANGWGEDSAAKGWVIGNSTESTESDLEFAINADGGGYGYNKVVKASNIFDDEWHHIVAIRNAEDELIKLYVDNDHKDTETDVTQSVSVDKPLIIGAIDFGDEEEDYDNYYTGCIDELAIWSRVLTTTEIAKLYNDEAGQKIADQKSNLYFKRPNGDEIPLSKHIVYDDKLNGNFIGKNFGFDQSNPTEKLDVNGNVKVSGDLKIEGSGNGIIFPDGSVQYRGFPSGAVMAFDLNQCPTGWSEFVDARGRTIIGTNPDTSNGRYKRNKGDKGGSETRSISGSKEYDRYYSYKRNGHQFYTSLNSFDIMSPFVALLYCKKD